MAQLILINGQAGVGKSTVARKLLSQLLFAAYISADSLISVSPFEWNEELLELGRRNAHLLIRSFDDADYKFIIMDGFLFDRNQFDLFLKDLNQDHTILYIWLKATQEIRNHRRVGRMRDSADEFEHFSFIDRLIPDLAMPFYTPGGKILEIDTTNIVPEAVAQEIKAHL